PKRSSHEMPPPLETTKLGELDAAHEATSSPTSTTSSSKTSSAGVSGISSGDFGPSDAGSHPVAMTPKTIRTASKSRDAANGCTAISSPFVAEVTSFTPSGVNPHSRAMAARSDEPASQGDRGGLGAIDHLE